MDSQWYWVKGLHDAIILDIKKYEIEYDYTQRKPLRNYLQIDLDSSGAMFDTTIKSIRLYNFKLLNDDFNLIGRWWWMYDDLKEENNRYILTINIAASRKQNKELKIVFEKAEIIRENI